MNSFIFRLLQIGAIVLAVVVISPILVLATDALACIVCCYSRADVTRDQMRQFDVALHLFHCDCGRFPSFDEGLDALVSKPQDCRHWKPYLEERYVPRDAWDASFAYVRTEDAFEIRSYGRDGTPYTADDLVETSPRGGL